MRRDNTKVVKLYDGKEARILEACIVIDPAKVRKIFDERKILLTDASEAMGYARGTLTSSMLNGYFSKPMALMLKSMYGIVPEEYELKADAPKEEEPAPEQTEIKEPKPDADLYQTVKMAVLDAINEALAGNMKNLRGMIYTAITQAKQ